MSDFESFIKHGLYLRNWSPRTAHTYRAAYKSLLRFQESQRQQPEAQEPGSVLTKAHLEAWVCWLRDTGVTPGGCNMYIRTVNSYLKWLQSEGKTTVPPVHLLKSPQKMIHSFSDSDIKLILGYRPKGFYELRTWTLISFLLDTGCRIDEALKLEIVDFDNLTATVTGKGSKSRVVPISLELRKTLFRFKRGHKYFFSARNGSQLMYRNTFRDIQRLCKKAGVTRHVHPHLFRHCFAVTYIRRGGDIYRLSRILGHTSVSTTQIYLRSMNIEVIAENHSSLSPLCLPSKQ